MSKAKVERNIPLEDAAQLLGVAPKTLRKWIAQGVVAGNKIGPPPGAGYRRDNRRVGVPESALARLMEPIQPAAQPVSQQAKNTWSNGDVSYRPYQVINTSFPPMKYRVGDKVRLDSGEVATVAIADFGGSLDNDFHSYDILLASGILAKHIPEAALSPLLAAD